MGGISSKSSRERSLHPSASSSSYSSYPSSDSYWGNSPFDYPSGEQTSPPRYPSAPSFHSDPEFAHTYPSEAKRPRSKYTKNADDFSSIDEVTKALVDAGLESSNLIVGIDFTKSNEWTGKNSFNRKCLHHISSTPNPYEQAISIIGRTLSSFDEDNKIPCFGFGDASTHDQDVFCFYPDERYCNGFEEVLKRYKEIVPHLRLAGPTSFAPIIEMGITIVEQSGGQYHVLLIIADGQVTRSVDTHNGKFSRQEQETIDAIVRASDYPLSIVLVGVGDGPWDMMKQFDDNIPARAFDNFQFVNFTEIMAKNTNDSRKEADFALAALMEIPPQYKASIQLGILGRKSGRNNERIPLPTPICMGASKDNQPSYSPRRKPEFGSHSVPSSSHLNDNQVCPICLTEAKNMAFGCGHQTCYTCGEDLQICPICRMNISTRIRLY